MEKLIVKFNLKELEYLDIVNAIIVIGYRQTGNKFAVEFNGSKGYLSNIVISCEGNQKERNNIIWIEDLRTKGGKFKSKMVSIFHSEENGIRVAVEGVM
jgi:hypothetical protein